MVSDVPIFICWAVARTWLYWWLIMSVAAAWGWRSAPIRSYHTLRARWWLGFCNQDGQRLGSRDFSTTTSWQWGYMDAFRALDGQHLGTIHFPYQALNEILRYWRSGGVHGTRRCSAIWKFRYVTRIIPEWNSNWPWLIRTHVLCRSSSKSSGMDSNAVKDIVVPVGKVS